MKHARKTDILEAAVKLAEEIGLTNVTRDKLVDATKVPGSSIQYHFKTMTQLRRDVMRHAVKSENLRVIAQGLAVRDPYAMKASEELRQKAAATLASGV